MPEDNHCNNTGVVVPTKISPSSGDSKATGPKVGRGVAVASGGTGPGVLVGVGPVGMINCCPIWMLAGSTMVLRCWITSIGTPTATAMPLKVSPDLTV